MRDVAQDGLAALAKAFSAGEPKKSKKENKHG